MPSTFVTITGLRDSVAAAPAETRHVARLALVMVTSASVSSFCARPIPHDVCALRESVRPCHCTAYSSAQTISKSKIEYTEVYTDQLHVQKVGGGPTVEH